MLKISKLADYATVVMNFLAAQPEQVFSAAEIAKQVHVAVPTVQKVLKLLSEAQLLFSTRGPSGGYRLGRPAALITVADVIAAIDGIPAMTECSQGAKLCAHEGVCAIRSNWRLINQVILTALQNLTLADMAKPLVNHPLIMQGIPHGIPQRILERSE